jgi:hypothetical protein
MHHRIHGVFPHRALHQFAVPDVALYERVPLVFLHIAQVLEVASISQRIVVHHADVRMVCKEVPNDVGPDESGAAGDEEGTVLHGHRLQYVREWIWFAKIPFKSTMTPWESFINAWKSASTMPR